MRKTRSSLRRNTGVTSIAEFGPVMWMVFIMITFPLMAFGTLGLRYAFLVNGIRYAAESASQAKSFQNDFTDSNGILRVSAVHTAQTVVNSMASYWHGVSIGSTTTSIVYCNMKPPVSYTTSTTSLTSAQLQAANVFNCQVTVSASLSPLFPQTYFNGAMSCPGITKPIPITCSSQCMFEYPQGLTQ